MEKADSIKIEKFKSIEDFRISCKRQSKGKITKMKFKIINNYSVLRSQTDVTLQPSSSVLHTAARLTKDLSLCRDYITPTLKQLHFRPIHGRILA